ncbi:hypothetical protein Btru_022704 [Bulinus truncatus]|nr:hypothetical protein Btru_022704 [Bulinus truncatus]
MFVNTDLQSNMPNVSYSVQGELMLHEEVVANFKFWFAQLSTTSLAITNMMLNLVNMAVFIKMGLGESVNFTLFCLSVSDMMGALFVTAITSRISGDDVFILDARVDFVSYASVVSTCRFLFVDLSTAITVFITCERCMCVVAPFRFSSTLIVRRTKFVVLGIAVFVIANYLPICIFICAVLMYNGLKRATEVRRNTARLLKVNEKTQSLSGKERRVVLMILVLAMLYLLSSLPQIGYCWSKYLIPDLSDLGMRHVNIILLNIIIYMNTAYGAFSFLVYFHFNRSFRLTLGQFCYRHGSR